MTLDQAKQKSIEMWGKSGFAWITDYKLLGGGIVYSVGVMAPVEGGFLLGIGNSWEEAFETASVKIPNEVSK